MELKLKLARLDQIHMIGYVFEVSRLVRSPSAIRRVDAKFANMAPLHSTKQKTASHGSRNTRKHSSTSDVQNAFPVQNRTIKDTHTFSPETFFQVRRKWPTWPNHESLAQKAANVNKPTNDNSNGHLTPMERWRMETQQQRPWNSIAAVNASSERRLSEFEESAKDGSQGGDTDNGTWWP